MIHLGAALAIPCNSTNYLTYLNELPDILKSTCKIFAENTSSFLKVKDLDTCNVDINGDLIKIS